MVNLARNLDGLREFLTVVKTFLEKEAMDYQESRSRELIPLALAMSASGKDPDLALSEERELELRKAFGAEFQLTKTADGGVRIEIPGEANKRFADAIKGLSANSSHQTLLYRNCLISLISSAEWFLSQVLSQFFKAYPDAAGIRDKTLTLEDLRRIGSIEEAQEYLVALRVDEIMWGGFDDWMKFLKGTVKLSMGYMVSDEKALVEVFQRRNVMVHNNGVVHPSYLAKVDEALRKDVVAGTDIEVNPSYLFEAINLVEKNFLLIAAELWKKLLPKDEARPLITNDQTMKALFAERYTVASGLSRFQMEDRQIPDKWITYGKLNYWQTEKWAGRFDAVAEEIKSADFSGKDDLSQMARYVLINETQAACKLLAPVFAASKLTVNDLEEWPIFKEFRRNERVTEFIEAEKAKMSATIQISSEQMENVSDENLKLLEDITKGPIN